MTYPNKVNTLEDIKTLEQTPFEQWQTEASSYEVLKNSAEQYAENTALRFLLEGKADEAGIAYTYRELFARVTQTANALTKLGIGSEDVVSIILPNLPQTHFSLWGGEAAGIVNPVNPLLEVDHIVGILNEAESKVLITLAPFPGSDIWEKAKLAADRANSVTTILTVDIFRFLPAALRDELEKSRQPYLSDSVLDFDTFIQPFSADRLQSGREIKSTDIASYFHTGGTTGRPKLAPHTHGNELANCWQMSTQLQATESDVALCGLPLFHVNGVFVTGLTPFKAGAEVLLVTPQGYRNPSVIENFWAIVAHHKVSFFSCVPTILSTLMNQPTPDYPLDSLRFALCGAAPLAVEVKHNFEKMTGLTVVEGYGLTEGSCASAVNPLYGEHRIGSVGMRLPFCEFKIAVTGDNGSIVRECKTGEAGDILIKGPHVFPGYKLASQNEGLWFEGGWFNTGDTGRLDADGYLYLTGRSKDIIIRGGHNIDPGTIEEVLYQHPAVELAAALGRPDARAGELPVAYIQLKPDNGQDLEEVAQALLAFAEDTITERAAVPKQIYFIEQMPVTAVGKVFKPDLRRDLLKRTVAEVLSSIHGVTVGVTSCSQRGDVATVTIEQEQDLTDVEKLLGQYPINYDAVVKA